MCSQRAGCFLCILAQHWGLGGEAEGQEILDEMIIKIKKDTGHNAQGCPLSFQSKNSALKLSPLMLLALQTSG